ncbi:MAG: nucleoside triphosphate pyrophosphatase [Pyrinomonadaceae bacterium]
MWIEIVIDLPKIILASASPRRAEILRTVGWPFETLAVDVDESRHDGEDATDYVHRLALEKAEAAAAIAGRNSSVRDAISSPTALSRYVIGADTTVAIDGHILEKPTDDADARRMLRLLNNRWHKVITGVAVVERNRRFSKVAHEETEVKFAPLGDADLEWYVATREPMDKAGAYAIQGLGARFIERIRGDYFNVVGLPVRLLYEMMNSVDEEVVE